MLCAADGRPLAALSTVSAPRFVVAGAATASAAAAEIEAGDGDVWLLLRLAAAAADAASSRCAAAVWTARWRDVDVAVLRTDSPPDATACGPATTALSTDDAAVAAAAAAADAAGVDCGVMAVVLTQRRPWSPAIAARASRETARRAEPIRCDASPLRHAGIRPSAIVPSQADSPLAATSPPHLIASTLLAALAFRVGAAVLRDNLRVEPTAEVIRVRGASAALGSAVTNTRRTTSTT